MKDLLRKNNYIIQHVQWRINFAWLAAWSREKKLCI